MSDNGCQPTSMAFMQACSTLGIQQAFTSYNNPKGNADTERVMRTLKEECLWLQEWTCPFTLARALGRGSTTTTSITYTPPWATSRPGSLNGNTTSATGLSSLPLDKWGALQLAVPRLTDSYQRLSLHAHGRMPLGLGQNLPEVDLGADSKNKSQGRLIQLIIAQGCDLRELPQE